MVLRGLSRSKFARDLHRDSRGSLLMSLVLQA